jgi:hypothetical protein
MERDSMGTEWGGGGPKPAPKRKLIDMHDVGGLILFGILLSPIVIGVGKWLLGM